MQHTIAEEAASRSTGTEELIFHPSASPTIGVECELMVLDLQTADLSSGAMQILTGCRNDLTGSSRPCCLSKTLKVVQIASEGFTGIPANGGI
jgi:hypothetical protein